MNIDDELDWLKSIGPVSSWDDLDDQSAERFDQIFTHMEICDVITEEQGKALYLSIEGMFDGYGTEVDSILSKIDGYPFSWVLYDDRDEIEPEDFVKDSKISSIEQGNYFPIQPLPTYRFDADPSRWLTEALAVNLDSYKLQKIFIYFIWSLGGLLSPTPLPLQGREGKLLLTMARDRVDKFEPKSSNLELEKRIL